MKRVLIHLEHRIPGGPRFSVVTLSEIGLPFDADDYAVARAVESRGWDMVDDDIKVTGWSWADE